MRRSDIEAMQVVVSFLLTLMLLALPGRARWLDGDDGVDRANGDLPGMPIDFTVLQPASDCAQLCLNTTKCVAWAYVKGDCGGAGNPQCYMKATVTNQTYNPCRVSTNFYSTRETNLGTGIEK